MTKRREIASAPEPLEAYVSQFDALFGKSNQREAFRWYLEGLLLPSERNKTLTGLVNTDPLIGAQLPRAQKLQWFLSESNWQERHVQAERLKLLRENPATAPHAQGALVIDETGDRKGLLTTLVTGGEVEAPISGCLLHDLFERRETGLFWNFSAEPMSELHQVHCCCDSDMSQVCFAKANVA